MDQLVLWPDPHQGSLRGELTLDPELTRAKHDAPTREHTLRVLGLLEHNLRYEVDGQPLRVSYEARELWAPGGATPGDLVVFSAELAKSSRSLRVYAGAKLGALAVTIITATKEQPSLARSWLLRGDEWTPSFSLLAPDASGWRQGGPEQFTPPSGSHVSAPEAPLPASRLSWRFIVLGFEHILPEGVDHMLFVASLVLGAARRWRHIVLSLTLFTLAHTLTLALGNLAGHQFSPQLVEPLIALSITIVALDNLRQGRSPRPERRFRHVIIFSFGLIHGMGFANALNEMEFGAADLMLALFSFNLGVELGQLAVVAALLGALRWVRDPGQLQKYVIFPGSAAIASAGVLFAIERLLASG